MLAVESVREPGIVKYTVRGQRWRFLVVLRLLLVAIGGWLIVKRVSWVLGVGLICGALAIRSELSESVMAIQNIGLQINHHGRLRKLGDKSIFIPSHDILEVVLNEVFIGFRVLSVLQVVTKDSDSLMLPFDKLLPRLDDLEIMWRSLREVLFADSERSESGTGSQN